MLFTFIILGAFLGSSFSGAQTVPDIIPFHNAEPNLYPEGFVHDVKNQRFLFSSLYYASLNSMDYNGVVTQLATPFNSALGIMGLGLELDYERNRVVFAGANLATGTSGIASFDLDHFGQLFAVYPPGKPGFDDVAIDADGDAYVTGLFENQIYKVTPDGDMTLLSTIDQGYDDVDFSLNGIVIVNRPADNSYLVVGCLNTIRSSPFPFNQPSSFYKVAVANGSYTEIIVSNGKIFGADGIVLSKDGASAYVVTTDRVFKLTSDDDWATAWISAEAEVESPEGNNPGATAGDFVDDDFYVIEGYLKEIVTQGPQGRTDYWARRVALQAKPRPEMPAYDEPDFEDEDYDNFNYLQAEL